VAIYPGSASFLSQDDKMSPIGRGNLFVPLLSCEFNKNLPGHSEAVAADQARLDLTTAAGFLQRFNIGRFPVFGLVANGSAGIMTCAWNERIGVPIERTTITEYHDVGASGFCVHEAGLTISLQATFVADQDAVTIDLRNPVDAINLATYVAYIAMVHAPRLRRLFEHQDRVDDDLRHYLLNPNGKPPLQLASEMTEADGQYWKR
jgi:hypothetical protein